MAGSRKAKHDIAPRIRAAFIKGFEKYCRSKGITYSDAMAEMIESEGLGYVLDRVSRFTVTEKAVSGKIDHEHTHHHEGLQDADTRFADILKRGKAASDKASKPH